MASPPIVLAAAVAAALYLTTVGTAVARLTGAWTGAASVAPALGWAVFVAVSLPVQLAIGLSAATTAGLAVAALAAAAVVLARTAPDRGLHRACRGGRSRWPPGSRSAARRAAAQGGRRGRAARRGGVGPCQGRDDRRDDAPRPARRQPVLRSPRRTRHPAYYYLWHFGAAQLSLALGITGWEADAALTAVTAYASVVLMMGLAARFGTALAARPRPAVALVGLLALTGGLRPLLGATIGWPAVNRVFADYRDLESWMSQACWVPQHLAAANSVVLVVLLLPALATRRWAVIAVTGIVAAAAFGSSAWVGGITLAVVAAGVAGRVAWRTEASSRRGFLVAAALAAVTAALVALPLIIAEAGSVATFHAGSPIEVHPFEVLGAWLPHRVARVLDLPAFWLILLPLDLPAVYPAAVAAAIIVRRLRPDPSIVDLGLTALLGLSVSWLLASRLGNNDLGWRAMLAPTLVLVPLAAAAIARWIGRPAWFAVGVAALLVAVGLPERIALGNVIGRPSDDAADFATSPDLWTAVRRHAGPADRVANNPLYLNDLTSFPVDISWALLADRSSCYAGWETTRVYGNLGVDAVQALDDRFVRVFAGTGSPDDVRRMAADDGCQVAVVTDADGAWGRDPFAASPAYRLAERSDGWRVYVRR